MGRCMLDISSRGVSTCMRERERERGDFFSQIFTVWLLHNI